MFQRRSGYAGKSYSRGGGFNRNRSRQGSRSSLNPFELEQAIQAMQAAKQIEETVEVAAYISQNKFEDFAISEQIKKNIVFKEYGQPTPIQDQAIPAVLAGRDVIGIANTGTGKTAAFLIPLIDKVIRDRNQRVLIVTPTRELAQQIEQELKQFSAGLGIYSALLIGGANINRQRMDLRRNPNFVIGTPGRIKDLSESHALYLMHFNNVVLDEADRMVDIGFIADIKYFISMLPSVRQSLFFSATISPKVQEILHQFVQNPITVSIKLAESAKNIDQATIRVTDRNRKIDQLHNLLITEGFDKVLIFGATKHGVQKLSEDLIQRGFKAGAIHGNKNQSQRQRTLDDFKRNNIQILLATDVASRGLDIEDVSHVINYDLPNSYEDYIHRIGRTGRANKKGKALTFIEA